MSLSIDSKNGVRVKTDRKPGRALAVLIVALEMIFSVFLYMSLAERVFVVVPAGATAGVPEMIAYQGLLTDTSGNPLGGSGTVYCFRYSIWDVASGGTTSTDQLWPTTAVGDASSTPQNSTTTVTDGVFSDQLGRTDSISGLDFLSTSTYFLQVQVSTSSPTCASGLETLTPRQQITADAWAQTSQSVYGNLLRTLGVGATGTVQIGTAGGQTAGNQSLLSLDVVNVGGSETIGGSCSQNGTLWYDSTFKRALVCENLVIQPISNGSTTIAGIGTNAAAAITAGNVVFSNSNGVTFGQAGSTITASVAAGGGGGTLSHWENYEMITGITSTSLNPASAYFQTMIIPSPLAVSNVNMLKQFTFGVPAATSVASAGSQRYSYSQGITLFSRVTAGGATSQMSMVTTASAGLTLLFSYTSTSEMLSATWVTNSTGGTTSWGTTSSSSNLGQYWTGLRYFPVPLVTTLTAGEYWLGYEMSSTTATANSNVTILSISQAGLNFTAQTLGVLGNTSLGSRSSLFFGNQGVGSVATANVVTNNTMAISAISNNQSAEWQYVNYADY